MHLSSRTIVEIGVLGIVAALLTSACSAPGKSTGTHPPPQYDDQLLKQHAGDADQVRYFNGNASSPFALVTAGVMDGGDNVPWIWTRKKAEFRFWPQSWPAELKINFEVSGATFPQTGPIRVSVLANGHEIGGQRYTQPQRTTLQLPLSASEAIPGQPLNIALVVDPPWISPSDKDTLGVQLISIGLVFDKARR